MKIELEITSADALVFFEWLNGDEGLREGAVRSLLQQHKPPSISEWTTITAVLAAVSGAIARAPGFKSELAHITAKRVMDIRRLADIE
jgi:hypothetical protein